MEKCIKQTSENTSLLVVKVFITILEKLSSSLLISAIDHHLTSQKYFDNLFPNIELP